MGSQLVPVCRPVATAIAVTPSEAPHSMSPGVSPMTTTSLPA